MLYSFFVAGHTYGISGTKGLHPPFKQKFEYLRSRPEIEFGILTGDIVPPNPVAKNWDAIDADIDTLDLPVYFAVGNHDMENRPVYESRYGQTYYCFIDHMDLFIILDPNIDGWNISGEQLDFLKEALNQYPDTTNNIYVFFHQLLWWNSDNAFNYIHCNSVAGRADAINFWTEIEPLFSKRQNEVYMFAGDLGAAYWASDVSYDHYKNISLIASGMGEADGENFIIVNVFANKIIDYDLICLSDSKMNCLGELTDLLVVDDLYIPSIDHFNKLHLYPNPATNYLTISNSFKLKTTFQLLNLKRELLIEEKYFNYESEHTIDVGNIPKGIYITKLTVGSFQSTGKIIIE